jgi:hypothetical protein
MPLTVNFDIVYQFNTMESGITVPVDLICVDHQVSFRAKIDTGSTDCIFERKHGENLQIDIESGEEVYFGTAIGRFQAFGHELTLSVLGLEFYTKVYFIAEDGINRNVLGRLGFLSNVQLGLIDYEGKLLLNQPGDFVQ